MADEPDTKTETHDVPGGTETTKTTHSEGGNGNSSVSETTEVTTDSKSS